MGKRNMQIQKSYIKVDRDIYSIMDQRGVPDDIQLSYLRLSSELTDGDRVELTNARLQKIFRCGYRRAMSIVQAMMKHGLIKLHGEPGRANIYEFRIGVFNGVRTASDPLHSTQENVKGGDDYPLCTSREKMQRGRTHVYNTNSVKKELISCKKQQQQQQNVGGGGFYLDSNNQSQNKIKRDMVMQYVSLLSELGHKIKNSTVYASSVMRKTDEFDAWDKFEEKIADLKNEIDQKRQKDQEEKRREAHWENEKVKDETENSHITLQIQNLSDTKRNELIELSRNEWAIQHNGREYSPRNALCELKFQSIMEQMYLRMATGAIGAHSFHTS
jgi:hypothetical protein